ncbi:MAG: aldo/keto reductase [SAR202 cluster bacterium]|nr:aldo/keto reductase [SAR202 cluster bacterium]
MQTRKLKHLSVPVIGMGSASSSGFDVEAPADIDNARRIIDNCIAHRTTFLDTSPMYRRAEGVFGQTVQGRRNKVTLATKVWCAGKGTGRKQIARSFKLLGTDHIEVFQIHNLVDWKTHLPYLEELKAQGKIGLIGLSHFIPEFYPEMIDIMRSGRVDTIQIPYNLLERQVEERVLPVAEDMGIGVIVMRPVGKGTLVTGLKRQPDLRPLEEFGVETWGQACLAWDLGHPAITTLIPATTKPSRIIENAKAGDVRLPSEMREYIEREAARCL